jgi:hypothetical protein
VGVKNKKYPDCFDFFSENFFKTPNLQNTCAATPVPLTHVWTPPLPLIHIVGGDALTGGHARDPPML